jgi:hypothetical protein
MLAYDMYENDSAKFLDSNALRGHTLGTEFNIVNKMGDEFWNKRMPTSRICPT